MKKIICVYLSIIIFSYCKKTNENPDIPDDFILTEDKLIVPKNSPLMGRIKTEVVTKTDYVKEIQSPASIEANPSKMVKVAPPLVGRIVKLFVKLGDSVKQNDLLFSIDAPELAQAQKDYLSAKATLSQAEIDLHRQNDLLMNGVGMQKEAEQAKTNYEIARNQVNQAHIRLRMYKIDPEHTVLGEPLKVYSPIKGRVVAFNVAPGEYHNDPNQTLITIADLSTVWIAANVREKDIRFVSEGEEAHANISAYPEKKFNGKVLFIDDILDAETRSVKVRLEFKNEERQLKPGMFATVIFRAKPVKAILISSKSLIQEVDKKFVFKKIGEGAFKKHPVVADESSGDNALVTEGLNEGDEIISEGSFYFLKMK